MEKIEGGSGMEPLSWAILSIIGWYFLIKFVKEIDKEKEKKKKRKCRL